MRAPLRKLLTNLHANPCGRSVSQRILRAHYTQISRHPEQARGAILIAEHSRPRGFFAKSGRSRPGRGISSGLVETCIVGRHTAASARRRSRTRRAEARPRPWSCRASPTPSHARRRRWSIFTPRASCTERNQAAPLNQLFGDYWPSYRQRVERSLGSGVIVDAMGTIVTNQHVIAGADSIRVQLADGRIADATIVGQDPDTDIAILDL